jgi:hypothetical protein
MGGLRQTAKGQTTTSRPSASRQRTPAVKAPICKNAKHQPHQLFAKAKM